MGIFPDFGLRPPLKPGDIEIPLPNDLSPIVDVSTYTGRSEKVKGFRRVREAIEGISGIGTIDPLILTSTLYKLYKSGENDQVATVVNSVFDALSATKNPVIVRRLFPDLQGNAQNGPRSANISSLEDLQASVKDFYRYFDDHYDISEVSPELMVHRVVDVTRPLRIAEIGLPFPGGDVIQTGNDEFQIRATFGADESVQGYPADAWKVAFKGKREVIITQTEAAQKTLSLVPSTGNYEELNLPPAFQEEPALDLTQVLSLATACRRMGQLHDPHRIEFDGTRIDGQESLFIIEAAPFTLEPQAKIGELNGNIYVFDDEADFNNLEADTVALVHLSSDYFRGNHKREALARLSSIAAERGTKLVVLASGNIATQHAARVLIDAGHTILFVGEERFKNGEKISVTNSKEGEVIWSRANPIVYQEDLKGKKEDRIGGKALGLQKLKQHGFTTPEFAVIETSLFRDIVAELGLLDTIDMLDSLPTDEADVVANEITDKIRSYRGREILAIQEHLGEVIDRLGSATFAVRSSATCEDGRYSFAGIFETKLNVKPEDISQAILDVLGSCLSPEAVRTMRSLSLKPRGVEMSVVVQEMVRCKKAGTIFTRDISSGTQGLLRIEATVGTGDTIVEGSAQEYQAIVVNQTTGEVVRNDLYSNSGEILPEEIVKQLIQLGLDIEKAFEEGPQDIEWAISEQDELLVLQARPL